MDVGTKSNTEEEKGQASDSFKRACVSVGIGRELYTAPFIWVSAGRVKIEKKKDNRGNEKLVTYDKFRITDIAFNDNREITGLTIINQDGKTVYNMAGNTAPQTQNQTSAEKRKPAEAKPQEAKDSDTKIQEINKELARTGVALDAVLERYGVSSIQEMDNATYGRAMNSLKRTKTKAA